MITSNVSIVIGSWGSYNECNERALGSAWLDLSLFSDWDEIVEELEKQGFELDGIDEELFLVGLVQQCYLSEVQALLLILSILYL